MSKNGFVHPDVLVSTDWAEQHLQDGNLRFVEVDVDTTAYDSAHLPGAAGWNW
jgi:thiosulfate/3-mercaptopyruvate sulfurtransferase